MLNRFANKLSTISGYDAEILFFGINIIFSRLLFLFVLLPYIIFRGNMLELITFISFFTVIRIYAGGTHVKSNKMCFILSILLLIGILEVIKLITVDQYLVFTIINVILGSSLIYFLSPVEAKNKPLDKIEKIVYRKKCLRNLCFTLVIMFILVLAGYQYISLTISFSVVSTGLLLITHFQHKY